ncbi:MAG TPA: hypothetical protein VEG28_00880 [Dehalococcoidia bacterium]|nr:hypothetical protein [Dehalococcoidia bacterium]
MRRGCIAIGKVECDGCHRPIKCEERYLLMDGEGDEKQRLCIDCCLSRGYISYGTEKGKQIITFLPKE